MVLGKMENFVASSPVGKGNFIFAGNLSSTALKVVSLEDRSSNDNSVENYNVNFNASLVVIVVGVVGFLFFIVFFFIIVCCRSTDGERSRAPRRAGGNNNVTDAATLGLERAIIESFPVFSYNLVKGLKAQAKGSECPVCLSDFQDDETVRLLPKCSHAFHPECIDMWLSSHTTCPVCRTSLLPADDSNPTGTDFGIVEPQMPPEQVVIDIDNGGIRRDISNDKETDGTPEPSHDSMRHSLVRVRKELEQQTEWYIVTPGGLKPGLHKSCSFVANHHSKEPSSSNAPPVCSKPGCSVGDGEQRSRSERWGSISMNPALFVRNFSERVSSRPRDQVGVEQQDRKPYLTRTFSWLMGGNRDRDRAESSQNGSVSSRHADRIVGTSAL